MTTGFGFPKVLLRLMLAMTVGLVIGYGRAKKQRTAGLRTYVLSSVGAALAVLISIYEYEMFRGPWSFAMQASALKLDVSRLAASVLTGIGFLGAGSIIAVKHQQISGLTSAAGMFACVCLGLACGAGLYWGVALSVLAIIFTLEAAQPLEIAYKRRIRIMKITVDFERIEDFEIITNAILRRHAAIYDIDVERYEARRDKLPSAILTLKLSRENNSHSDMLSTIAELKCVRSVQEIIA